MIYKLQERLKLTDAEIEQIKTEQEAVAFSKIIILIVAVIAIFAFVGQFVFNSFWALFFGVFISLIFLGIGFFLYNQKKKAFSLSVKKYIIGGLFEEQFSNVIYQPEKGLSQQFIKDSGLYPMGNIFESDDLLSATYKNVGFIQSDVLIQDETSDGETTTTTTLFHGRWLVCDFIKEFEGYHQIRTNRFFKNRKPFKFFGDKLKQFEFENKQFNKKFTTYTTDQKEAFYLINPGYMQRLENFVEYIGENIVFGFINNKLHVAIYNNKDAFELKGNKINEEFITRIDEDIKLIKLIIDELDLELDIFR